MAERQGLAHREIADRAAVVVVQVRPADAAKGHGDTHFTGEQWPVLGRVDPQVLLSVTNSRKHHGHHLHKECAR